MKFSAKARYALRMMARMASEKSGKLWRTQELAKLEGIPVDYVAQILQVLKRAGLIDSHRGAQGGFSLARDTERVSVAEVVEAADGSICLAPVTERKGPEADVIQAVWDGATRVLRDYLDSISIGHLAAKTSELKQSRPITFEI